MSRKTGAVHNHPPEPNPHNIKTMISEELNDQFVAYMVKTGMTKAQVLRQALTEFLERAQNKAS